MFFSQCLCKDMVKKLSFEIRSEMNLEHLVNLLQPGRGRVFESGSEKAYSGNYRVKISSRKPAKENAHLEAVGALRIIQSESDLGCSLLLAKHNKDNAQKKIAIDLMMKTMRLKPGQQVIKASGAKFPLCIRMLVTIAVENITRTADCPGARCRCGGRGYTICRGDKVNEKRTCSACKGSGVKRVTSSAVYRIIKTLIPDISQSSWSRQWKPFFEEITNFAEHELFRAEYTLRQYCN